jgi:prephenate dehydrogenase
MRIAILGVGLIGGSIGLAARRRLDAEVAGFDPERAYLDRALDLGALDRAADSVPAALDGAELAFCAAPVRALPDLVATALAVAAPTTAITDVGSTKRELLDGLAPAPGAERFVGGHPLAGAETAGVANARDDLFEGARWYLTPTAGTGGIHYDHVQRAIAGLGARPRAIDAATHDRLMAAVSHLPQVVANALAASVAASLGGGAEGLSEVGPSFRDGTRVAGANPAIWSDIFATNRVAVAGEIDAIAARLADAAELIRGGEIDALDAWHRAAGEDRRRLLEAGRPGGPLRELRMTVENRPGIVAEIALALGGKGVNIEDMALYPAADMRTGAISLWVAGDGEAERTAALLRGLGHSVALVSRGE